MNIIVTYNFAGHWLSYFLLMIIFLKHFLTFFHFESSLRRDPPATSRQVPRSRSTTLPSWCSVDGRHPARPFHPRLFRRPIPKATLASRDPVWRPRCQSSSSLPSDLPTSACCRRCEANVVYLPTFSEDLRNLRRACDGANDGWRCLRLRPPRSSCSEAASAPSASGLWSEEPRWIRHWRRNVWTGFSSPAAEGERCEWPRQCCAENNL